MKKIYFLFFAAMLSLSAAFSQSADQYIFAASSGATLDPMTGATTILPAGSDNNPSDMQTIPFTFVYEGRNYTQFSASPNGLIKLGDFVSANSYSNNIFSGTTQLFPFWDDLATGANGSVSFVTTGTAPNRILKIQWSVTVPKATAGNANALMQLWMYETTKVIEFRYGAATGVASGASIGINGVTNYNFLSVTTPDNTVSNQNANNNNTAWPGAGTMYKFTPPAVAACTRPVAQGTSLTIPDKSANYLGGSFTDASDVPSGYLVVVSQGALNTSPADGAEYVQGSTLGNGTVVQSSSTTSFTATGLNANTQYTISVFSFNSGACSGGPLYDVTSPLTGSATTNATLPVTIKSFTVNRNGLVNNLKWETAAESNTLMFAVERSDSRGVFIKIGEVVAAGNSNTSRYYQFNDVSPVAGTNFYRLKTIDKDLNTKLSEVKSIRNSAGAYLTFYPNPVKDRLKVDINATTNEQAELTITAMNGTKVYSRSMSVTTGNNSVYVDAGTLQKGTYIIRIKLGNDNIIDKFTKL